MTIILIHLNSMCYNIKNLKKGISMKLFFSTITEVIESFKPVKPSSKEQEKELEFINSKLQNINESSMGFFEKQTSYEKLDEKIMNMYLEEDKKISAEELSTLTTYITAQSQNNQTKKKFFYQLIISIILLGVSTYFILNQAAELKSFGFSTMGLVIGYWLK